MMSSSPSRLTLKAGSGVVAGGLNTAPSALKELPWQAHRNAGVPSVTGRARVQVAVAATHSVWVVHAETTQQA